MLLRYFALAIIKQYNHQYHFYGVVYCLRLVDNYKLSCQVADSIDNKSTSRFLKGAFYRDSHFERHDFDSSYMNKLLLILNLMYCHLRRFPKQRPRPERTSTNNCTFPTHLNTAGTKETLSIIIDGFCVEFPAFSEYNSEIAMAKQ